VELLGKGDLLFLAVVLLAVSVDWSVQNLLLTPRNQVGTQTVNYLLFLVTLVI